MNELAEILAERAEFWQALAIQLGEALARYAADEGLALYDDQDVYAALAAYREAIAVRGD